MGFFSIFSEDKNSKIDNLKKSIEQHKANIEIEKKNMAKYKVSNAPKHYQESGKKNIAHLKNLITKCKAEILRLK